MVIKIYNMAYFWTLDHLYELKTPQICILNLHLRRVGDLKWCLPDKRWHIYLAQVEVKVEIRKMVNKSWFGQKQ